jgi:putative transposase
MTSAWQCRESHRVREQNEKNGPEKWARVNYRFKPGRILTPTRDLFRFSTSLAGDTLGQFHFTGLAMPRRPRLDIPGIPLHITHRGVNRAAVFVDTDDFVRYRSALVECCARHGVLVHAYVLMTNHVHLLVSTRHVGGLSRAMSRLGQLYVPEFNRKHGRTGTLWEGRFKSCLVESERYLLAVYRYIELNPVRAAIVDAPESYPWSSVHANLGLRTDALVTPHPIFVELGLSGPECRQAYRSWLREGLSVVDLHAIRAHIRQERALGSPRFQEMVERTLNRPVACRPRGRPRKQRRSADDELKR